MPKPFVMALAILGFGVSGVGADQPSSNPSTWRYAISTILQAQRADARFSDAVGSVAAADFGQRYQRYSATGQPEAAGPK